jgi:apolipoprotein N-acyltransferase
LPVTAASAARALASEASCHGLAPSGQTIAVAPACTPARLMRSSVSHRAISEARSYSPGTAKSGCTMASLTVPGDVRNSLTVTAGPAPPLAAYDKWKLVPFGEYMPAWIPVKITPDVLGSGFTPGPGPRTITAGPLPPFDPLICYEAIFSGEIVQPGARPAWMLNITDDSWFGTSAGPQQAFAAARLRAVEEGLPLARDANSGITAMIDAFGRVNAIVPLNREVVLLAILPSALPETIYGRYGLWIPLWVGLLGLITGLFAAVSRVSKIMTIRTRV